MIDTQSQTHYEYGYSYTVESVLSIPKTPLSPITEQYLPQSVGVIIDQNCSIVRRSQWRRNFAPLLFQTLLKTTHLLKRPTAVKSSATFPVIPTDSSSSRLNFDGGQMLLRVPNLYSSPALAQNPRSNLYEKEEIRDASIALVMHFLSPSPVQSTSSPDSLHVHVQDAYCFRLSRRTQVGL